ncbi:MAG TPA: amino acid adenylation domain-containing protein, partial [Ktedonobacteraceae bacterium]|nr:amino acid adenylation domain-containing protein [Ktedonobacteraceae bacterium]
MVEIVQPPRRLEHTPLFQVMFAWQNNQQGTFELPDLNVEPAGIPFDQIKFDLGLMLREAEGTIVGRLSYAKTLFDAATIERQSCYLLALLRAMVADAQQSVARIDVLPSSERDLLLETWNRTETTYPAHLCIHQLFEQQVRQTPEAIALVFEDQALTYAELNVQANRLAHLLIKNGVKPDERVAICVERSPTMVVGLLAILKAGSAYVPLDPSYPTERLIQLLNDAEPVLLLADSTGQQALGEAAIAHLHTIDLDQLSSTCALFPTNNPDPQTLGLTSRHLAYVIYTSGSTGTPKGVMVEHAQVVNFLRWSSQVFEPLETVRTLFSTSINFDLSVYECFVPLIQGTTLHLVDDVLTLMRIPQEISLINTVPSAIRSLLDAQAVPLSVHTVNLAGEPLKAALIRNIFVSTQTQRVCNLYGPSETTTYSTWMQMSRDDLIIESIGRPIANTRIYLLDNYGQPVPLGAVGEIHIGGAGVARGYLNRPELTAERFLLDPFSSVPGARMYKTGDLARYLPDGNLEFLGRNDQQVKIRGFRIELGEIEARLAEHPTVHEATVVAREDTPGDKRLVAYVVAAENAESDLAAILRTHLSARLPEYMVPAAYVRLDALPLTPNGKLDRKALPAPEGDAYARQAYAPPQGEIEQTLATLWAELLGIERISRHDNFFELGGHSLLAVQLMERLRRLGLGAEVRTLFATPTLAELAAILGSYRDVYIPPNAITPHSTAITPDMLPLIDL